MFHSHFVFNVFNINFENIEKTSKSSPVIITNYIEELIENGEISLIGKDVDDTADALYACAISEKYGENIFDCNEDEE